MESNNNIELDLMRLSAAAYRLLEELELATWEDDDTFADVQTGRPLDLIPGAMALSGLTWDTDSRRRWLLEWWPEIMRLDGDSEDLLNLLRRGARSEEEAA